MWLRKARRLRCRAGLIAGLIHVSKYLARGMHRRLLASELSLPFFKVALMTISHGFSPGVLDSRVSVRISTYYDAIPLENAGDTNLQPLMTTTSENQLGSCPRSQALDLYLAGLDLLKISQNLLDFFKFRARAGSVSF